MTDPNEDWIAALECTHQAVRAFARSQFDACARKIVYRLRRIPTSGIYGDDLRHRTLWDEFCYERQQGPTDALQNAWQQAIEPHLESVIEALPTETAVLLSIYSCWNLEEDLSMCGSVWADGMKEVLNKTLIEHAMGYRKAEDA